MVRAKQLVIRAELMGMGVDIATIKIGGYARQPDLRSWTDLVCPEDFKKPTYHSSNYKCECGATYTTWQKLLRVKKGTTDPVEIPKLTKGNGEIERAKIYTMSFAEFSKYADAMDPKEPERYVTAKDESTQENLVKLLLAQEIDKTAIIITFNDTTEQKIALLTTTVSGRIVLRFIIPTNLVQLAESMLVDKTKLTEKDIEEARMFLKQIPKATEETLSVSDYRVESIGVVGTKKTEKVEKLAVIMQRASKKKAK